MPDEQLDETTEVEGHKKGAPEERAAFSDPVERQGLMEDADDDVEGHSLRAGPGMRKGDPQKKA